MANLPPTGALHIAPGQLTEPMFVFSNTPQGASSPREIMRITCDGRVILNEGITWDQAAQHFWEIVEKTMQPTLIKRLAEARKLLEAFCPPPDHNLPPNSVPAKIAKFLAAG